MSFSTPLKWKFLAAGLFLGLVSGVGSVHAQGAADYVGLAVQEAPPVAALPEPHSGSIVLVHRRADYHCHQKRGYRHWCHQGESNWRDGPQSNDGNRRYRGRPYYPRETYRQRSWPRSYYRRRYDRDRPDWRRWPYDNRPSVYQAI